MISNFIEIKLRHRCSRVNLLHIFRTPFPKNVSGGLLLMIAAIELLDTDFTSLYEFTIIFHIDFFLLFPKWLFYWVYPKSWILDAQSGGLDSGRLDRWTQDAWMLGLWTLGVWTTGHLDSGLLYAGTLDAWTLVFRTFKLQTTGRLDSGGVDSRITFNNYTLIL